MFGNEALQQAEEQRRQEAARVLPTRPPAATQAERDLEEVKARHAREEEQERAARAEADRRDEQAAQEKMKKIKSYGDARKIRAELAAQKAARAGKLEPRPSMQRAIALTAADAAARAAYKLGDTAVRIPDQQKKNPIKRPGREPVGVKAEMRQLHGVLPPAQVQHAIGARIVQPVNPEPQPIFVPQAQAAVFQPRAAYYQQPDPWAGFNAAVMGVPMARRVAAGKKLYQESPINRFARLV